MKTVVLGTGRMGRRHIQVVRELGLNLVGIYDQSPDSLALTEKEQGVPSSIHFTSLEKLLGETRPECVIVSTTAPSHCEFTCRAAASGARFILCEKPMAVSLEECDRMLEACRQQGTHLAINHQMRFMEQYTEPKRMIELPEFGGLSSITVVAGNFGMAMNGLHYLEMFRFMTGESPAEVAAWFSKNAVPNPRGPQFADAAGSLRAVTRSGKRFYMEIGDDMGHGMLVVYAGPFGRIEVDELAGIMRKAVREEQHRSLPSTRYGMPWRESTTKITLADSIAPSRAVLQALLSKSNYPTGAESRLAVAGLVAAYVSNETGHSPVNVDGKLPQNRRFPWA